MAGHIALPMVAARDIAEIALRRLVRQDLDGIENIPAAGPENLSFNHAALIIGEVLRIPMSAGLQFGGAFELFLSLTQLNLPHLCFVVLRLGKVVNSTAGAAAD